LCYLHSSPVLNLSDLLMTPSLSRRLVPLAGLGAERRVEGVKIVESLERLQDVESGTLAVLTAAASREAATYRFDIALRLAASHELAGVVLTGGDGVELTEAAAAIADRGGVAVFHTAEDADLGDLIAALHAEIAGGAEAGLARAKAALDAIVAAEAEGLGPDGLLAAAAECLGTAVELRDPGEGDLFAPMLVDGRLEGNVCAPGVSGARYATELVLHLTAAAVARASAAARLAEEVPAQSRAELLGELLSAEAHRTGPLLHRARSLGLAVDGWHVVVQIDVENTTELAGGDELVSYELVQRLARASLEAARAAGGSWHRAGSGSTLRLVRIERDDPGAGGAAAAADVADRVLRRLRSRMPELVLRCGVGSVHAGPTGLRTAVAEAHAAVAAARLANRANVAVRFDEVGLRRTLIEWYASDAARDAVQSVLEPLERLGPQRGEEAIRTLEAYLDHQGSLTRTAKALHLHRNAVAYRIKRIFDRLAVDREDPDQRLLLQLACRARSLR
jgi:sugar diacid utilization regulator